MKQKTHLEGLLKTQQLKKMIILGLTFRSVIHLEPVFWCGVRQGSPFVLLHGDILLSLRP